MLMRINKKLRADLLGMKTSANADTAGKTTTVILRVGVKAADAEKLLGETFNRLAFGPMTETEDGVSFPYATIKPDIVVEKHMVHLIGHGPIPVSPILTNIKPMSDEAGVYITLELPMAIESKGFAGDIWAAIGEVVDAEFEPSQLSLPLADGTEPPARGVKKNKAGPWGNGQTVVEQ